jgi:hypothetical protein
MELGAAIKVASTMVHADAARLGPAGERRLEYSGA